MEISTGTPRSRDAEIRVLRIPELTILILSYLDNRTLLLAQRVSRDYQSLIVNTPTLQRKLFFRPGTAAKDSNSKIADDAGTASGAGSAAAGRHVTYPDVDGQPEHESRYVRRVHLNPLLVWLFPPLFPGTKSYSSDRETFRKSSWAAPQCDYNADDDDKYNINGNNSDKNVVVDNMPRWRKPYSAITFKIPSSVISIDFTTSNTIKYRVT